MQIAQLYDRFMWRADHQLNTIADGMMRHIASFYARKIRIEDGE